MQDKNKKISPKEFTLPNGRRILIRGINSEDKHHFRNGINRLSLKSVYYRFNNPLYELNERDLDYFTEVDQVNHVAIGALALDEQEKPGVGVARFIRLKNESSVAELAITVIDDYQKQGVGSLLLNEILSLANDREVKFFRIFLHTERRYLLQRLLKMDGRIKKVSGETLEVELPVC